MATNKVSTKSYLMKRLRDSGYVVNELFDGYGPMDSRQWSIIIDPGCASVIATCYENHYNYYELKAAKAKAKLARERGEQSTEVVEPKLEKYIELDDGGHFLPPKKKIYTVSAEVIIEQLVEAGINNKHPDYGTSRWKNSEDDEVMDQD